MNKQTAFWMMVIGAAMSVYDIATTPNGGIGGDLYGTGKPLESLRVKVYTRPATTTPAAPAKDYYASVSDAAAVIGAFLYFR